LLTRFAPAPTGWLHLGHVLNAEYVWGEIGPTLGERPRVLLRIEDHDRERCRPEYEAGILEDLAWLGYVPDFPFVRQSDRQAIYHRAAQSLVDRGLIYACDCTRKMIEARYSGRCRDRGLPITDGVGWRVRMDPGVETFDDLLVGPQTQDPFEQSGDVLIRDRLRNWTYQFAASVDDFDQGIDLVIRGVDLLDSTGRQIRIARLLGRERPATFMHHPLLMKTPTHKLSKSDGDTGIRDLRARGWTVAQVQHAARESLIPDR
jgi:glutamyl-Q tRNA(Asp) synthetase